MHLVLTIELGLIVVVMLLPSRLLASMVPSM
jgi:hypothetical protein